MAPDRLRRKGSAGLSWSSLKKEWRSWYASKHPTFYFALKFGALIVFLYAVLAQPVAEKLLYSYLEANAGISSCILNVFGQHTHSTNVTIQSPHFSIALRRGCDAIEPTWLFCAAILAFPGPFLLKIPGMLGGLLILQLLNIVRIVTLFWVGVHLPDLFHSAHLELWPAAFIILPIVLFMRWRDWSHGKIRARSK